ncbi:patatin-like phospholipase family protein [Ascidiimonas sp. W6]|uniref:patatin-like phospholipase family protein n=1 Tax=Ascidiimonas meishanensis TaxID=3128903 RepID=UPI0030EC5FB5
MKRQTKGLVLSGGGHRGVAHIGAIKAFEEAGLSIDIISGTSAGAIVGALYAAGKRTDEMLDFFRNVKLFSLSRFARKKPGFIDTVSFHDFMLSYFPANDFLSLKKKLFVTATNLISGSAEVFHQGDLITALMASASFPGIFTPVKIKDSLYADGGILDNFPLEPLRDKCEVIYGVDVSPIKNMKPTDFKTSFSVMERAYYLSVYKNSTDKFRECEIMVHPKELSSFSVFNSNHLEEIFTIGYNKAKETISKASIKNNIPI